MRLINRAVTGAIWLLLLLAPLALIYRNLPQIRTTNGPMLKQYAALLAQALPSQRAVLLSDDPRRSLLLQAYAAQSGKGKDYLFLDTELAVVARLPPVPEEEIPATFGKATLPRASCNSAEPLLLVQLISRLAQTNSLYYLHPSFGYYFEFFYPEPHGLVYKLNPYPTNALFAPPLSKELIAENEAFWAKADEQALQPLLAVVAPPSPGKEPGLMGSSGGAGPSHQEPNHDATTLAGFYSRALDYWGVEMQKSGRLTNAAAISSAPWT